jgi:hypothetical protein
MVFAGIGAAIGEAVGHIGLGTAASLAAGFATNFAVGTSDELLTSKLTSGWKPNQFIEGGATEFVHPSAEH